MAPAPDGGRSQEALLEDACGFVAQQRPRLGDAIARHDVRAALRATGAMANELRTSLLALDGYYRLFMLVVIELQRLAAFLAAPAASGGGVSEQALHAFELAQSEGSVVPRLYLAVTAGAVAARADLPGAEKLLDELTSMLGCVQHPVRGLFLRHYLLQSSSETLSRLHPRVGLRLLLTGFRGCVSLWNRARRLEGAGASSSGGGSVEGWQLDGNRHALRLLVSAQLMHMSRLPGLTPELHLEVALPEILQLLPACEDGMGQAYLLQALTETFPDEFHLAGLEPLLAACAEVHWLVDLRPFLVNLLVRLSAHVSGSGCSNAQRVDVFATFDAYARELRGRFVTASTSLPSLLRLQLELLLAALVLHPGDAARVQSVLAGAAELLEGRGHETLDDGSARCLVDLLAAPLARPPLAHDVLAAPHHAALLGRLDAAARRAAALAMVSALADGDVAVCEVLQLRRLLPLVAPLLRDEMGPAGAGAWSELEHDAAAFAAEQEQVVRLVHQLRPAAFLEGLALLEELRRCFGAGGPARQRHTLPALVVAVLALARRHLPAAEAQPPEAAALLELLHGTLERLNSVDAQEALRHWLLAAATLDSLATGGGAGLDSLGIRADGTVASLVTACGRCLAAAAQRLESAAFVPDQRLRGLQMFVGTLQNITHLDGASARGLVLRAEALAAALPSARLRCEGRTLCASLYCGRPLNDGGRLLQCLREVMHAADALVQTDPSAVVLLVGLLERTLQAFNLGLPKVTASFVSCLLAICMEHLRLARFAVPEECLNSLRLAAKDLEAAKEKESEQQAIGSEAEARPTDSRYLHVRLEALQDLPGLRPPPPVAATI